MLNIWVLLIIKYIDYKTQKEKNKALQLLIVLVALLTVAKFFSK